MFTDITCIPSKSLGNIKFSLLSKPIDIFTALFWSYFPAFELNTERYSLSLRIQYKSGKIRTSPDQNNSEYGHFSCSDYVQIIILQLLFCTKSNLSNFFTNFYLQTLLSLRASIEYLYWLASLRRAYTMKFFFHRWLNFAFDSFLSTFNTCI